MGKVKTFPAIVIPREHQSAPREHWADEEVRKAAEEISEAKWSPDDMSEQARAAAGMGLAMGLGQERVALGEKPTLGDFRSTHEQIADQDAIAQHPRVIEALAKLKEEARELKGHELIEHNCALRELTAAAEQKNRWDGQGRWMGAENEQMRHGKILSPQAFYDKLAKVTGKGRIKLSEHVIFPGGNQRSGLSGIFMRNPRWNGEDFLIRETKRKEAEKIADECNKKWREAMKLKRQGKNEECERLVREVSMMATEGKEMYNSAMLAEVNAEPEFVRVATAQWPLMTEWMIVEFTEWGTVWKPKFYGWRTALLTMIRAGAIKEAEAHKAFPIGQGPAGEWYHRQIYEMRQKGGLVN